MRRYLNHKLVNRDNVLGNNMLTNANNCKTLMDEHRPLTDVTPGPVGAAMALSLGESNKSGPVNSGVWEVMDGKYATHFCL